MEENKERDVQSNDISVQKPFLSFLRDMLAGACIGVAFIIPGFSGGSVAAILGVYEKMITAIANVFKEMKKSIITLLPIGIGLVLGVVALLFPLQFMLSRSPLPTVSLFIGLALGGIPSLTSKLTGKPNRREIISIAAAFAVAVLLCFIPIGSDVNLFDLSLGGYLLLFAVGIVGASALVVPGISGSMLLLILGYYNPIVNMLTNHFFRLKDLGKCVLVLGSCGIGIAVGFFLISLLMKQLLLKHPRPTYFAIIGFIMGSLPTVYVSTMKSSGMISHAFEVISLPSSPVHYAVCAFFVVMGACASYQLSVLSKADE